MVQDRRVCLRRDETVAVEAGAGIVGVVDIAAALGQVVEADFPRILGVLGVLPCPLERFASPRIQAVLPCPS